MSLIRAVTPDFTKLSPYQDRHFVPTEADLSDKDAVAALYQKFLERGINSAEEFEKWILDRSELEAAVQERGAILYIQMTCQTDDQKRVAAYQTFIEEIVPTTQPLNDQLNHKFLREQERFALDGKRYGLYLKEIQAEVELFSKKNIPIKTQLSLLSQEYQAVCGRMTVKFQEKERTLPEMGKFLLEPDRSLREAAWRATAGRRLQDRDNLDELFEKMFALRNQIAGNAGCENYRDYQFRAYHRFDYTPDDCKFYHKTIEHLVVPVWKEILKQRRDKMNLDSLRPWDTSVDPQGRKPLKPFTEVAELIAGVKEIFNKLDPELGAQFRMMDELGLLDLSSRKGKAPGGYQSTLPEVRKPFIFMNAVGVHDDVNTLLHEGGHAFHSLACAHDPLLAYRHGPMEFNEVASMAMELLGGEHLDSFYDPEGVARCRREHLEGIVHILCWVATVDAFQHWLYENPGHTREERRRIWVETFHRFGSGMVHWDGLDDACSALWHRQLHIFEVPFYYIEYGIAQLGALQLWSNARRDFSAALNDYRKGLSLGGSRPLPELYATAGIKFDFSEKTIAPLVDDVVKELKKLND